MTEREPTKAAEAEASAAPEEVLDAEVVEEQAPSPTPGMPGSEAEDRPVDSEPSRPADDGLDLTSPASAEGPGDSPQGPDELTEAREQRDSYLALAQRTQADFENYRKRMAAEVTAAGTRAKVELAGGLISVLDNLEHALTAAGVDPRAALDGSASAEGELANGVALTYRELVGTLGRAGVVAYDPAGEPFDPTWHEALQARPAEGAESGTVIEVLQKGYRIDQQVIRAARVVVAE